MLPLTYVAYIPHHSSAARDVSVYSGSYVISNTSPWNSTSLYTAQQNIIQTFNMSWQLLVLGMICIMMLLIFSVVYQILTSASKGFPLPIQVKNDNKMSEISEIIKPYEEPITDTSKETKNILYK